MYTQAAADLDEQHAQRLATSEHDRSVALATAHRSYAGDSAAADATEAIALAGIVRDRAVADADDEATYRETIATVSIDQRLLQGAMKGRLQQEVNNALYQEAVAVAAAWRGLTLPGPSQGDWDAYWQTVSTEADSRGAAIRQARIDYAQDAGDLYVEIHARTDVDGTTSAWEDLGFTLEADPGATAGIATLSVANLQDGVTDSATVTGSVDVTSGSAAGLTVEFDLTGDGVGDATTTTDAGGTFTFTPAAVADGFVVVAARVGGGPWTHLGFLLADDPQAPRAVRGWVDFLVDRAAARYAWAQATSTEWLASAAAVARTRVDYANAVATDYVAMIAALATTAETYSRRQCRRWRSYTPRARGWPGQSPP